MHTISSGDKVLVTGANGFIAMWIVRKLLEKGYAVRGTVRSADKAKYLEEYFKAYGHKFEFTIVEDITKYGAFDKAVKGIQAIIHTASPFYLDAVSVNELLEPAVNGTVSILKSALAYGQEIKRVVVISSAAAVSDFSVYKLLNEDDWNEPSIKEIKEKGADAAGYVKYFASKTAAERVVGGQTEDFLKTGLAFIDVRDVAQAHVLALEKEAAGGERIIISAGSFIWQQWVDAANSLSLPNPSHSKLPIGYPGLADTAKLPVEFDTRKAARILGLTYLNQEQVTRDSLADFVKRGW
ncbi:hypothetical protein C0989_005134 [Termitomyces sp. Mn162]|nr:hypothetical protein C0989_005134 [Termitomyces sp. Mn162]